MQKCSVITVPQARLSSENRSDCYLRLHEHVYVGIMRKCPLFLPPSSMFIFVNHINQLTRYEPTLIKAVNLIKAIKRSKHLKNNSTMTKWILYFPFRFPINCVTNWKLVLKTPVRVYRNHSPYSSN